MTHLTNIPTVQGRPGVDKAMEVVTCAVEAMVPDGQLAERWSEFRDTVLGWSRMEEPITPPVLYGLRLSLEQMCGDDESGELLVAAAKMGMSAVLLAAPNAYVRVLKDRDEMHDDIAPLIEKGVYLLKKAGSREHWDPTVRVDYDISETLKQRQAEAHEGHRQDWANELIRRAVRAPGAQN